MNRRIAAIEAWFNAHAATRAQPVREGGVSPAGDVPAELKADLEGRFHHWLAPRSLDLAGAFMIRPIDPVALRFAKAAVWLAVAAFAGALWSGGWVIVPIGVTGLVLLAIAEAWNRGGGTASARHGRVACSACGYDLSASLGPIPPELLDGLWIGPRQCPECGAAWPLLPPPAPPM